MKLYYSPGACSMASHIVLNEYGFDHQAEPVDLKEHKTKSGEDFYKINSKGYIPALVMDNGKVLTEGVAILLYLAEKKTPIASIEERAKLVEWLVFIATELHKGFSPLFYLKENEVLAISAAKEKIAKRLDHVEKHLANSQYLLGGEFSVVDAYLFTVVNWSDHVKLDLSQWKNVKAFHQRIAGRPSVQKTLKEESLIK